MLKRFSLLLASLLTMVVLADAGQEKDAPKKDAPVKDKVVKDAPVKDKVVKDAPPVKDKMVKDAPKDKMVKDEVKKDAPKKDAPKKEDPKVLKGTEAKITKIDLEKKLITVEADKKTVELKVTDTTKFIGPRGGLSDDGIKDDRVVVGNEVRYVLDSTGKNLAELHLPVRMKK